MTVKSHVDEFRCSSLQFQDPTDHKIREVMTLVKTSAGASMTLLLTLSIVKAGITALSKDPAMG